MTEDTAIRAEERAKTFDLFEQTLFEVCTGAKIPGHPIEKVNAGFENFVKLSTALRKALGEEWPNR